MTVTPALTPLTDRQTATRLVDAISARSHRLQSIFSSSFTSEAVLSNVEGLTREIDEACIVLRRYAKKQKA